MEASEVVVELSARAVVASGQPFSVWGESLSDVGVALDTISDLRPHSEPLVLRVRVSGEAPPGSPTVAGDWLCEADGSAPRRIRKPDWHGNAEDFAWGKEWLDAWERCPMAQWMLRESAQIGVDPRLVVGAACACAEATSEYIERTRGGMSVLRALETSIRWCSGKATEREVRDAVSRANRDRDSPSHAVNAAYDAAEAAEWAAEWAADRAPYIRLCVSAVGEATEARTIGSLGPSAGLPPEERARRYFKAQDEAEAEMAGLVRSRVPTLAVLRAAV